MTADVTVNIEEAIGAAAQPVDVGYVHLLAKDVHSDQSNVGYRAAILSSRFPVSFERWIRLRFEGTFDSITAIKFWSPNLVVPAGWSVHYGISNSYAQPTSQVSSIAQTSVPMSKPNEPNVAASAVGLSPAHSPWLVLQARVVDPTLVESGSILGGTTMIDYRFGWTEK